MFGYIKPYQPELKLKELDAYKAVYCGLCGQLGRSFGPMARLTLSYDFTFLAMLQWAVSDEAPVVGLHRCYVNPLKKLAVCEGGEPLAFGADNAVILLYYKLIDNIRDDGMVKRIGWQLLRPFAAAAHRKAAKAQPGCEEIIARNLERQRQLEAAGDGSVDAACEPMAAILGGIFRTMSGDAVQQRVLERLGYVIGRYIYLCDALDDMEQDAKSGNYNPFVIKYRITQDGGKALEQARGEAVASLNMTIGEAEKTRALLTLGNFSTIIDNILTLGLHACVEEILSKKENTR